MRIVSIPVINGVPQYQDFGGIQDFGRTDVEGDFCIGEYKGSLSEEELPTYVPPEPPQEYRTRLKSGEVIALLKDPANPNKGSYAKIYRAAYPQGNKQEDDIALEFLEQAKYPYSEDGLIDVSDIEPAMDYFISQNYMDADDKARVMQGWKM